MAYYPIFLEIENRPGLVIGGGAIAYQKAQALVRCGGQVSVVSPVAGAGIRRLIGRGKLRWRKKRFEASDLNGIEIVIAATNDPAVNEQASRLCRSKKIWINVVDQPKLCSFIVPSVVRRGKLTLAISTAGIAPALSKWIRKDLEKRYGPHLGRLLQKSARIRGKIQRAVPNYTKRKRLYEKALAAYFEALRRQGAAQ